jgi:sarcosine oxidase, subunit gamma
VADLARTSALRGAKWHGDDLDLAEVAHSAKFLLRGGPDDGTARQKLEQVLGCSLPAIVGPVARTNPAVALLAPNRWLMLGTADSAASLLPSLAAALEGSSLVLSDLSDGLAEIAIDGARAADLLASATPLDLRVRSFGPASLAQTQFARTTCLLRRRSESRFDLLVDSSYAGHVWSWLLRHAPLVTALS